MKTHKLAKDELQVLNFHSNVRAYHELTIARYIRSTVYKRLKIDSKAKSEYDLQKGELKVLPSPKVAPTPPQEKAEKTTTPPPKL